MTQPDSQARRESPRRLPGSLTLVLPAHNEEANLGLVVERALTTLPEFADHFEIVIVDDGSRDRTGAIADALAARDDRVRVVHHARNRGYGGALTSGFAASTADYVMFMDSDRQFDIADLSLLAPFVGAYDIVAGFRRERSDPLHRRVMAETFNVVVRVLFGVHLRDIDCAFKIFRGDLLRSLELSAPGALINTEIQAKARRQGARLIQVGVHHYPRVAGHASGGSVRVVLRAMAETVLLWWRLRGYRPLTGASSGTAPYRLGDAVVALGLGSTLALLASVSRRLSGRRRPSPSTGSVDVERPAADGGFEGGDRCRQRQSAQQDALAPSSLPGNDADGALR
ncbi:MAG: glycosyltransferase family 2 protein [Chloroflexia bacterium]|nr:glycosyltransferase family 2 protein [Chloroflexia bacterium]